MVDSGFLRAQITTKGTDLLISTRDKLIPAGPGLLALASEMDNVRPACGSLKAAGEIRETGLFQLFQLGRDPLCLA